MNPAGIVLSSVLLSAAAAYAVVQFASEPAPRSPGSELPGRSADLERLARLEQTVADLATRLAVQPAPEVRRPDQSVDEATLGKAVRAWLDAHRDEVAAGQNGGGAAAPAGAAPSATPEEDFDDLLGLLTNKRTPQSERQSLWQRARAAGLLDRMVAAFEERARKQPANPDAQVDLGNALLQKLFVVEDGPAKGTLAMKADAAFDKALELDERHWDARFNKAVSLSFWPPVFGKQGEAIQQFETLLAQQGDSAVRPEFAQTYMFLGNLYEQQGKSDQAMATWRRGLTAFPDDAELRKRTTK
jgi:tetratricopeptide (TPR) repeat protein